MGGCRCSRWEKHFVDDRPIDGVEQWTGLRVEALDASAVVTGVDSRFNLTVDGARICIGMQN